MKHFPKRFGRLLCMLSIGMVFTIGISLAYADVVFHGPFPAHPSARPPAMRPPAGSSWLHPPHASLRPHPRPKRIKPHYGYGTGYWGGGAVIRQPYDDFSHEKVPQSQRRGKSCVDRICIGD